MLLQSIWKFSTPLCKHDNKDSDGFSVSKKLYSSGRCSQETFNSKFFIPRGRRLVAAETILSVVVVVSLKVQPERYFSKRLDLLESVYNG